MYSFVYYYMQVCACIDQYAVETKVETCILAFYLHLHYICVVLTNTIIFLISEDQLLNPGVFMVTLESDETIDCELTFAPTEVSSFTSSHFLIIVRNKI